VNEGLNRIVEIRLGKDLQVLLSIDVLVDDVLDLQFIATSPRTFFNLQDVTDALDLATACSTWITLPTVEEEHLLWIRETTYKLLAEGLARDGLKTRVLYTQSNEWK